MTYQLDAAAAARLDGKTVHIIGSDKVRVHLNPALLRAAAAMPTVKAKRNKAKKVKRSRKLTAAAMRAITSLDAHMTNTKLMLQGYCRCELKAGILHKRDVHCEKYHQTLAVEPVAVMGGGGPLAHPNEIYAERNLH